MPYTQWTELVDKAGFTPAGRTIPEIEPGYYDLALVDGRVFFVPVRARTDELLKFPDSASGEVIDGIKKFWNRKYSFRQYGITYKRGVLLYGPPGSGKTSTLQIIARQMVEMNGLVLTYNRDAFLPAYRALRDIQPEIPVVTLMEDFEEQFANAGSRSKLLNLLDGVEALDNVVFLATTNYPEKLEPRIVNRPSRFDQVIRVPHPGGEARSMYLEALLRAGGDDEHSIDIDRWVRDTEGFSLAHVKELFISFVVLGMEYRPILQRLKNMQENKYTSLDDTRETDEPIGALL